MKEMFIKLRRYVYHKLIDFIKFVKRLRIKNKEFTIISNNCWGGMVYSKYGIPYATPTVGIYFMGDEYVKFCGNLKHYMEQKLEFFPFVESRFYPFFPDEKFKNVPAAKLGDIEVYFMHYKTEEEAESKWERRKERMHWDRIIYKFSERLCYTKEDAENFMALPVKNKICFSHSDIPGAIVIPELKEWDGDEHPLTDKYFDVVDYLNKV